MKGIGCSDGFGIGKVLVVKEQDLSFVPRTDCDVETELSRFHKAVDEFCDETIKSADRVRESVGENEANIIMGHIMMIKDPYMMSEIEKLISGGQCVESSLSSICDMFAMVFSAAEDELTQQRATDVADVKNGILSILLGCQQIDLSHLPENTVIVTRDLTPSMTAGLDSDNVVGIVTEIGGRTSHSAIMARAMEIPAALSVTGALDILSDGMTVIVNGFEGEVISNPSEDVIKEYTEKRDTFLEEKKALAQYIGKKTLASDGEEFEIAANIGTPEEAGKAVECDCEAIGLFRTEFLFMDRDKEPTEEEQFEAYKKVALILKEKPVIIRTLDVGGDKEIPYLGMEKEENPFLGFRAIRYCIKNESLYENQLRALVRASAFGDIRIMVPLVTGVNELRFVKEKVQNIMNQLDSDGISYNKDLKIGVMIETPAACMMADVLAKEADFFSIGTNDLTQYMMAVDRGNANVAYLYSTYNPAVLRAIERIIKCAREAGIPVGMCGEAAADKKLIPLLLAFGLNEFSVNPVAVLSTRHTISKWSIDEAKELAQKAMSFATAEEVEELLTQNIK